jgi:hypothetical protein
MRRTGTKATSVINHGDIVERQERILLYSNTGPRHPSTNGRSGYQWKVAKEDAAPSKGWCWSMQLPMQMQVFA